MPERFKVVCTPCKVLYKCSAFTFYWLVNDAVKRCLSKYTEPVIATSSFVIFLIIIIIIIDHSQSSAVLCLSSRHVPCVVALFSVINKMSCSSSVLSARIAM